MVADSKWITYAKPEEKVMTTIHLFSLEDKKSIDVTDGWFDSSAPVFSSDGKYLFFVSNRSFSPTYGQLEWNHIYQDLARVYLITLAKETKSPFAPKSDEVTIRDGTKEPEKGEKKKEESKAVVVKVDPDGIESRIAVLPVTPASYPQSGVGRRQALLYPERKQG